MSSSKDPEAITSVGGDAIEIKTNTAEDRIFQAESGSNLVVLRNSVDEHSKLALLKSIITAPLQIEKDKIRTPIYSDYLTSRIAAVVVEGKTYHLHTSLLCQNSLRFKKDLGGGFQENKTLKINLSEESSGLFSDFVDFLYLPGWTPACRNVSDFVYLPNLYAMGERLLAQDFQNSILRVFINNIRAYTLESAQICRLLSIACQDITERQHPKDDPMRELIFWFAASKLTSLQQSEDFRHVLTAHAELGRQLSLRAGNGTSIIPRDPFNSHPDDEWTFGLTEKRRKTIVSPFE